MQYIFRDFFRFFLSLRSRAEKPAGKESLRLSSVSPYTPPKPD